MTGPATDGATSPRRAGCHASAVFSSDEAWADHVFRFLRQGLERGERLHYFADSTPPGTVTDMLSRRGLDVRAARERGQLTVMTAQEAYLASGGFDPDTMVEQWHTAVASAVREGYAGLRAVGEMSWYGRGVRAAERLLEYELRIHEEVFARLPLTALCLYDRRLLPEDDVAVLAGAHLVRMDAGQEPVPSPVLRVAPLPDRPGLRLAGDANADSHRTVEGTVAVLSRLCREGAELDLSQLEHIDAAGAARLASVATRAPGGRLAVLDPPPSLTRLMGLFPEMGAALEVTSR
ncbi:MEDS domain-containing protein [Streptomyces sp. TRM 70351]|uniref:MEDS domain-containing protein n=1 Tax=Streptomyces sp. TRM 70351 TaxID=3116552 RepID=UPI002E7BD204|nr:MEDS domain-containing protein [Streptomyces sp. TRM 70351]MEE1930256.1 MEDS domain-containing protein [Streptomyces sp. TRM 70351]